MLFFHCRIKNSNTFYWEFEKKQDPAYSPHARLVAYRHDDDAFWSWYMTMIRISVFCLVGSRVLVRLS